MASNTPSASFAHVLPDRWRILGVLLRPFCIGHAVLLERLESPFAIWIPGGHREPSAVDLMLALRVCALPYDRAERWLISSSMRRALMWDQWRFSLWFHRAVAGLVLEEKVGQFRSYLEYHLTGPLCVTSLEGRKSGTPIMRRLYSFLVCQSGMSAKEAMSTIVSDAFWHFGAHWEMHGAMQIQNEQDDTLVAAAIAAAAAARSS